MPDPRIAAATVVGCFAWLMQGQLIQRRYDEHRKTSLPFNRATGRPDARA